MVTGLLSSKSKKIGIGIIGLGNMGECHARNIHFQIPNAQVSAIMDINPQKLETAERTFGSVHFCSTALDLIHDPCVDAVVIASPDSTHAELTLACLDANKSVLCEKPLAPTALEARKVIEKEIEIGRRLVQVGFMRHYDPAHVRVKQSVEAGVVGRPILFKGFHRNESPDPYTEDEFSEGVIINSAIHDLDSCRWLLGQEITTVHAMGTNTDLSLGANACDLITIHLSLSGGCLGMIDTYVNAKYGYEVGVEIVGEIGAIQTEPSTGNVLRSQRSSSQTIHADWLQRFEVAYLSQLHAWCASLDGATDNTPTAWDGYSSLIAAEACVRSLQNGTSEQVSYGPMPDFYAASN